MRRVIIQIIRKYLSQIVLCNLYLLKFYLYCPRMHTRVHSYSAHNRKSNFKILSPFSLIDYLHRLDFKLFRFVALLFNFLTGVFARWNIIDFWQDVRSLFFLIYLALLMMVKSAALFKLYVFIILDI